MIAVVKRYKQSAFGTRVQKPLSLGIGADHAHKIVAGEVAIESRPALPVVGQLVNVGPEIIHLVARHRNVGNARFVRTDVDSVNLSAFQIPRCYIYP